MSGFQPKHLERSFRALAVLLGTVGGLLLVEGGAAVALHYVNDRLPESVYFEPVPVHSDPYLQYRIRPNVRGSVIETNSLGLRNQEIATESPDRLFRVLLLGGSVAWGNSAASNSETIAAILESSLNDRYHDEPLSFEVLNGGVPGYVSWQVALYYALYLRQLRPHLVITIDGVNDVYSAISNQDSGLPVSYQPSFQGRRSRTTLAQWFIYRVERSRIMRLGRDLFPRRIHSGMTAPFVSVGQSYRNAMDYLGSLVRRDGGHLQLVLQPMSIFPEAKALTPAEREGARNYLRQMPDAEDYFRTSFAEIRSGMRALGKKYPNAVADFDGSNLFSRVSEQVFLDQCHLTLLGRTIFARELERQIVQFLDAEKGI